MSITGQLPKRGVDDWGSGAFGARRGDRVHKGIDYACYPGTEILAPVSGRITKLGYPYSTDLSYRYVEITDAELNRHRFFYVSPLVEDGQRIQAGEIIGQAQDIAQKYNTRDKRMKNHVHYEILGEGSKPINPESYL